MFYQGSNEIDIYRLLMWKIDKWELMYYGVKKLLFFFISYGWGCMWSIFGTVGVIFNGQFFFLKIFLDCIELLLICFGKKNEKGFWNFLGEKV